MSVTLKAIKITMPLEKTYIIRIGNFSIRWNIEVFIEISSRNMTDWHNTDYIDPKKEFEY